MKYYRKLGFVREPFSNSPDPMFLYDSPQHLFCLQQLEISARLKRGLNVIIGDIGTGKTTLCRRFVADLDESGIDVQMILDPSFKTAKEFLLVLYSMLTGRNADRSISPWELKELVKKRLFRRGVRENVLTVLAIDEGQKLSPRCLEVLRELLNYETNAEKLVQIVIFAQSELEPVMQRMPNFVDRINFFCRLTPMTLRETSAMIRHRLNVASPGMKAPASLFSAGACYRIYKASHGYPRRIVRLCHKVVLGLIIADRKRATYGFVSDCIREEQGRKPLRFGLVPAVAGLALLGVLAMFLPGANVGGFVERVMGEAQVSDKSVLRRAVGDLAEIEIPTRTANASAAPDRPQVRPDLPVSKHNANDMDRPHELGTVRISFSESLSTMIKDIYGVFNQTNLAAVAAANPGIADINAVEVGTSVRFPVIESQSSPQNKELEQRLVWVEMASAATLPDAFAALRRLEYFNHPARILPTWSAAGGLSFSVVGEMPHASEKDAQAALDDLPVPLRKRAHLLIFHGNGREFLGQLSRAARRLALQGQSR